jgi:hypothetical protein
LLTDDGKRSNDVRRKRDCGRRFLGHDRLDLRRRDLWGRDQWRRRVGLGHERGLRRQLDGNERLERGRELECRQLWHGFDRHRDNGECQLSGKHERGFR